MRRKLIQQGKGALTISLPKKWIELHNLKAGEEIHALEDNADLIIRSTEKTIEHNATLELPPNTTHAYRSLIGSLYRGGFDKLNIKYTDLRTLPVLQKTVNSLYGLELFDITDTSCIIKTVYEREQADLEGYERRIRYAIKTMLAIIIQDIEHHRYESMTEVTELRNTVLKQRDFIMRIIKTQKLLNNKDFPFYSIALSYWDITRNFFQMYKNLDIGEKHSSESISLLKDYLEFFDKCFKSTNYETDEDFLKLNPEYQQMRSEAIELLHKDKRPIIASFLIPTLMSLQFASSMFYLTKKVED